MVRNALDAPMIGRIDRVHECNISVGEGGLVAYVAR
jgi:hypothetical protein